MGAVTNISETKHDCFGLDVTDDEIRRWDKLTGAHPKGSLPERPDMWDNELFVPPTYLVGGIVVELGCGMGHWGREVAKYAATYVGIDISRYSIHKARSLHVAWDNMRFYHSVDDIQSIQCLTGKVLGVYGISFFIHQPKCRFETIVGFASNMLMPGGWLSVDYVLGKYGHRHNQPAEGADWRSFNRTASALEVVLGANGLYEYQHHVSPNPNYDVNGVPRRGYVVSYKPLDSVRGADHASI